MLRLQAPVSSTSLALCTLPRSLFTLSSLICKHWKPAGAARDRRVRAATALPSSWPATRLLSCQRTAAVFRRLPAVSGIVDSLAAPSPSPLTMLATSALMQPAAVAATLGGARRPRGAAASPGCSRATLVLAPRCRPRRGALRVAAAKVGGARRRHRSPTQRAAAQGPASRACPPLARPPAGRGQQRRQGLQDQPPDPSLHPPQVRRLPPPAAGCRRLAPACVPTGATSCCPAAGSTPWGAWRRWALPSRWWVGQQPAEPAAWASCCSGGACTRGRLPAQPAPERPPPAPLCCCWAGGRAAGWRGPHLPAAL